MCDLKIHSFRGGISILNLVPSSSFAYLLFFQRHPEAAHLFPSAAEDNEQQASRVSASPGGGKRSH